MDGTDWHWPTVWSSLERLLDIEAEQRRTALALGHDYLMEERDAVAARRAVRTLMARRKPEGLGDAALG